MIGNELIWRVHNRPTCDNQVSGGIHATLGLPAAGNLN